MMSQRHKSSSSRDTYLDAARDCILDVGLRRTTLTEVARRAGVSRMTIYRAWPDMSTLLRDLMTQEWQDLLDDVAEYDDDNPPTPDGLADQILRIAVALRHNPLFVRILELDPELVLPYLTVRRGRSQELIINQLSAAIEAGQRGRQIRAGDPVAMARALVLAGHGSALSVHTMVDERVNEAALDEEWVEMLRRTLTP